MLKADLTRPGIWTDLFPKALGLMAHLERETRNPQWSFGGGTVLMLRINHRQSKDIDLFVPDPQYLGYVNPRLSDAALDVSDDYEENAEFIKLNLPEGEIDIVVGTPLTSSPFELVTHAGMEIRVETNAEIIAKKFWHRGDRPKARDLFDLCAVAVADPASISVVAPFMARHGRTFLQRMGEREAAMRDQFGRIDVLAFNRSFDDCAEMAKSIIGVALEAPATGVEQAQLFVGPIVDIGEGEVVQRVNRHGDLHRHRLAVLTAPVALGDLVEIRYQSGVGVVLADGKQRNIEQGR
jgi:hypothetical protein